MHIEVIDHTGKNTLLLPPLDRAELFGDGFFTTGVIHRRQFCHQQRHFERLLISADRLLFNGLDLSELGKRLDLIVTEIDCAAIRISISRRQAQRGYSIALDAYYSCTIMLSDLPAVPSEDCRLIDAKTAISSNPTLAGLKHLNRLDSVLAASEISEPNQEVLMYHGELAISGSKSNLFVKTNGVWLTPALSHCGITGITRDRTLEMFKQQQIQYSIIDIKRSDLVKADAAFMTNSLIGIWPVTSINARLINTEDSEHIKKLITRI